MIVHVYGLHVCTYILAAWNGTSSCSDLVEFHFKVHSSLCSDLVEFHFKVHSSLCIQP